MNKVRAIHSGELRDFYHVAEVDARIASMNATVDESVGHLGAAQARIAELESVLRAECIFDVGQREEQWYCSGCGKYADKAELIQHDDCRVAKALGL